MPSNRFKIGNTDSKTHGFSYSKLYGIWNHMRQRCNNPKTRSYHSYGGRGVKLCEKWVIFEGFLEDMLPEYKEGLSLDRRDVNGNYCKQNCRWVDKSYQAKNRRNTIKIQYQGREMCAKEVCIILGIPYSTFYHRYKYMNWTIERSLNL